MELLLLGIITEEGFNRLLKFSSEWALKHGKSNIVIADKPNVLETQAILYLD